MVADAGFTGRLELRTARLAQADTFVARSHREQRIIGPGRVGPVSGNQRVYRVTGTRESVNRLVASLSGVWQNSSTAPPCRWIGPEASAAPVMVEAVTPEQAAGIVAQNSTEPPSRRRRTTPS